MRIAVVVRSLAIGGMERVAVSLSEALADEGHESHLIYFRHINKFLMPKKGVHQHNFALKREMDWSGIGLVWKYIAKILNALIRKSFFVWSGLFTAPLFSYHLWSLEKEYGRFDLIIFRGQGTFEMIWPLHDDRFVFVNEGNLCDDGYNSLEKIYAKLLFNNRKIVSVSDGVMDSFLSLQKSAGFQAKQAVTITNPIDVVATRTQADAYIPDIDTPYILSVGRLHPVKNISLLVEAYGYAREHFNLTHKLVIIGEGKDRPVIEKKISELHLDDYIVMKGQITNPFPWMKHAKLFVLSSKSEGLGMVLLESMACGTAVVATDSPGGVRGVMKGELSSNLSEQSVSSLASKIVEVLSKKPLDYSFYLTPYLPQTITNQFIENFYLSEEQKR